jgi:hypothetical protein
VAQVWSPSVADVLLTAPRWNIISNVGCFQERVQRVRVDDAVRRVFREVQPLPLATQQVGYNCFMAATYQSRLQVGTDEASAAGAQNHDGES